MKNNFLFDRLKWLFLHFKIEIGLIYIVHFWGCLLAGRRPRRGLFWTIFIHYIRLCFGRFISIISDSILDDVYLFNPVCRYYSMPVNTIRQLSFPLYTCRYHSTFVEDSLQRYHCLLVCHFGRCHFGSPAILADLNVYLNQQLIFCNIFISCCYIKTYEIQCLFNATYCYNQYILSILFCIYSFISTCRIKTYKNLYLFLQD